MLKSRNGSAEELKNFLKNKNFKIESLSTDRGQKHIKATHST